MYVAPPFVLYNGGDEHGERPPTRPNSATPNPSGFPCGPERRRRSAVPRVVPGKHRTPRRADDSHYPTCLLAEGVAQRWFVTCDYINARQRSSSDLILRIASFAQGNGTQSSSRMNTPSDPQNSVSSCMTRALEVAHAISPAPYDAWRRLRRRGSASCQPPGLGDQRRKKRASKPRSSSSRS